MILSFYISPYLVDVVMGGKRVLRLDKIDGSGEAWERMLIYCALIQAIGGVIKDPFKGNKNHRIKGFAIIDLVYFTMI